MSEPPKIVVNGGLPQPSLQPAPAPTLSSSTDPAGLFERSLAKSLDGFAGALFTLILSIFSVHQTLSYLAFLLFQMHLMQSALKTTPGKWLMGLQLQSTTDAPITYGRAFLRLLSEVGVPIALGIASGIFSTISGTGKPLGVILIWLAMLVIYARPILHPRRHAWHDTIAKTEVVRPGRSRVGIALAAYVLLLVVFWNFRGVIGRHLERLAEADARSKTVAHFAFKPSDGKSESPCLITKYCLTAYVTPWCPACEQTKPTLKRLQSVFNDGSVGVQVIMGQDQLAKLEAACSDYGSGCGLDSDGVISKNLGVGSFPTYFLWDTSTRQRVARPRAFSAPDNLTDLEFKNLARARLGIPSS